LNVVTVAGRDAAGCGREGLAMGCESFPPMVVSAAWPTPSRRSRAGRRPSLDLTPARILEHVLGVGVTPGRAVWTVTIATTDEHKAVQESMRGWAGSVRPIATMRA